MCRVRTIHPPTLPIFCRLATSLLTSPPLPFAHLPDLPPPGTLFAPFPPSTGARPPQARQNLLIIERDHHNAREVLRSEVQRCEQESKDLSTTLFKTQVRHWSGPLRSHHKMTCTSRATHTHTRARAHIYMHEHTNSTSPTPDAHAGGNRPTSTGHRHTCACASESRGREERGGIGKEFQRGGAHCEGYPGASGRPWCVGRG